MLSVDNKHNDNTITEEEREKEGEEGKVEGKKRRRKRGRKEGRGIFSRSSLFLLFFVHFRFLFIFFFFFFLHFLWFHFFFYSFSFFILLFPFLLDSPLLLIFPFFFLFFTIHLLSHPLFLPLLLYLLLALLLLFLIPCLVPSVLYTSSFIIHNISCSLIRIRNILTRMWKTQVHRARVKSGWGIAYKISLDMYYSDQDQRCQLARSSLSPLARLAGWRDVTRYLHNFRLCL